MDAIPMDINLLVTVVGNDEIDRQRLIDAISSAAKNYLNLVDPDAAVIVGPASIESEEDFISIKLGGLINGHY